MAEKNKKLEHIQVKDNGIKVSQKVGDVLAKAKQLLERDCFKGLLQASDETNLMRYRIAQNNAFEKYRKTTQSIIKNAKNEVKQALKEDKTVNLSNKQVVQISSQINNGLVSLGTDAMKAYQSTLKDIVLRVKSAGDLKEQLGKHIASGLNIGVTYKDGKTYQFDTYWEMKARTDIQQEIGNNMISTGQENGIIFYITSFYGDCAPDHAEYQGKIYVDEKWESMAPKDRLDEIRDYINSNKLLTVQEVTQNPPFLTTRPNCRHYFQYIDIDSVLGAKTKDDVNQLRQERDLNSGGKYKPDKYKALQQQRQNERKIRSYKADLEKKQISLALEPGNKQLQSEIEIDKSNIRMFQKAQRDLAKQYSNIERRYDREKVGNRIDFGVVQNVDEKEKGYNENDLPSRKIERNNILYEVDNKVDSKDYESKMYVEGFSPMANKALLEETRKILHTNNKTTAEDIFLVTPEGKIIKGLKPKFSQEARRSQKMIDYAKKHSGYVVVHNHPGSLFPSGEDLNGLIETWGNADCCRIACHNGEVWEYRKKAGATQFDKVSEIEYNKDEMLEAYIIAKETNEDYFQVFMNKIAEKHNLIVKKR